MKKIIFILLCFCLECNGQNRLIDSLQEVLKTTQTDTNRINTLNMLSSKLRRTSVFEPAKTYANEALQLSEKVKYKKGKVAACNNLGAIYEDQANYPEAMKYFLTRLKTSEEIGDKNGKAYSYFEIGNVNYLLGNGPEAYKNYFAALKIMEELGDKGGMAKCYISLRNSGTYDDALKYLFAALNTFKEINDRSGIAHACLMIGAHYDVLENYQEALKYYFASLIIAEEIGDKKYAAMDYGNISMVYLAQGNYADALKYNFKALKIQEETGDKAGIVNSYNNLGSIYTKQKKFAEADKYLNGALALAIEISDNVKRKGIYRDLIELDSARGDYKKALSDYRTYYLYSEQLVNESTVKQMTEMKAKYESEKKEKEITLLTKNNEIQNMEMKKQRQLMYSFIGGLTLIILLMLVGYRVYRDRQMLRLQDIRNKIAGDLHDDIGSTLNSISVYSEVARKNDAQHDEALEMIGDSSRKIIDAMSDIVWTINPENDSFAKIIFRMKSLAHNLFRAINIEYTFHADERLDEKKLSLEDRRNFYLIFKEAINNLVKYSEATRVVITLSNENERMKLYIKDNGIGFDMSQENAGNGLKSMKRRADEMKAKFIVESQKGNGTEIELIMAG